MIEIAPYEPEHLFRIYDAGECGDDGYPFAWHHDTQALEQRGLPQDGPALDNPVKDIVRHNAGNRCLRCGHPYSKGDGEWSTCDASCTHGGEVRKVITSAEPVAATIGGALGFVGEGYVEARWRILTVHHLLTGTEGKRNLLWWNLVSLCQRCHLTIQKRVDLRRVYPWPHTEWFRPYAAGWYAFAYLGEHLSRAETLARLPELLALEGVTTEGEER